MEDNHMHTLNVLNHLLFNSHPHMEDDRTTLSVFNTSNFSTHILTRRMTKDCVTQVYKYDFSTHILTRRMTVHDDTSLGVLQFFNSHPHKEDDQPIDGRKSFYNFSTHILTWRMTLSRRSIKSCKTFQLTSSQGG